MSNWSFLEAFIYRQSRYDNCKCSLLIEISSPGVSLYRYLLTAFQLMLLLKRTKTAFPLKYFIIGHLLIPASPSHPRPLVSYLEQAPACLQTLQFLLFILRTLSSPPIFMGQFLVTTQKQSTFLWETLPKELSLPIHELSWFGLKFLHDVHYSWELQWSPVVLIFITVL